MKKKETFSLRKYKIGTVSVLLGAVFLFAGAPSVAADEVTSLVETKVEATVPDAIVSESASESPVVEELVDTSVEATSTDVTTTDNVGETLGSETLENITNTEVEATQPAVETPAISEKKVEEEEKLAVADETTAITNQEEAKPQNIDSNTIITVPKVWDSGYKGEGTVVAIIDSGLDVDHDVLHISDLSTAKYKSEKEIEAAKEAAGITYGKWFNDKVVFGYNYVDVNTVLKEEDKRSHGMHVTSIATGNPTQPVAEQLMYGVAPEAQVMFMRVFSDLKATTGAALYAKAIEDAVKLGADSINLSLGGANGSVVNMNENVTAAIEAARRAGVSVVIAAGKPHLAISPNGDDNQDSLAFKGVFLRNYTDLVASVYAADDTERTNPLWESQPQSGNKNFYSGDPKNPKSSIIYPTEWNGTDSEGNALADGKYQYVLTYSSEVPGAAVQTMIFDVIIDRESPVITTATYDETNFTFNPRPAIEKGESGLYREQVFYLVADASGVTTIPSLLENGDVTVSDNKVFVAQNDDGSFTLPLDLADISKFYYTVEDYAGNISYEKVENLISIGNEKGLVTVNILDKDTNSPVPILFSYSVTDETGKIVAELPRYAGDTSVLKLPFGTYTFDLFLYDTEWSSLAGETKAVVTISEEHSTAEVNFYVTLKDKANLLVDIDALLPSGSTIQLVTADGQTIQLPNAKYSKTDYGKFVPVGTYTILPTLPEGYEFLEELNVAVLANQSNVKKLTLINKVALKELIAELAGLEETARYYNASPKLQTAYAKALEDANAVYANKHNQAQVDSAVASLVAAREQLNGQATDTEKLIAEVSDYTPTQANFIYYNAENTKQIAYDTAIRSAQLVLNQENVTQAVVNQALADLLAAKANLDGQKTDISALRSAVSVSSVLKATDAKYLNASENVKQAYGQAVEAAKAILADESASQASVDQALAVLTSAQAELDGVATSTNDAKEPANTSTDKKDEGTVTPPPRDSEKVDVQAPPVKDTGNSGYVPIGQKPNLQPTLPRPVTLQASLSSPNQEKQVTQLPNTGENDTRYYLVLGVIIGLGTLLVSKRRHKEEV
ncbi:S8 family serine peptidase [Streptococcus suis]|uniref:S8 family serine peptidase n=1 Tax=Streptococcus suis TaxID=1307 RepID=UPI000943A9E2|nr:S8 family serine peptidase [Streptococcus suis]